MIMILPLYFFGLVLLALIQETGGSAFDDLGKWLLGGFALAVALAIALVFIKLRLRDKERPPEFLSINSSQNRK
jgi:hypothetical protein